MLPLRAIRNWLIPTSEVMRQGNEAVAEKLFLNFPVVNITSEGICVHFCPPKLVFMLIPRACEGSIKTPEIHPTRPDKEY